MQQIVNVAVGAEVIVTDKEEQVAVVTGSPTFVDGLVPFLDAIEGDTVRYNLSAVVNICVNIVTVSMARWKLRTCDLCWTKLGADCGAKLLI